MEWEPLDCSETELCGVTDALSMESSGVVIQVKLNIILKGFSGGDEEEAILSRRRVTALI